MNILVLFTAAVFLVICQAQTVCRPQTLTGDEDKSPMALSLDLRENNMRRRRGPLGMPALLQRSIVQCHSNVEVLEVPNNTTQYEGVELGAIVTIVETEVPLRDSVQAAQRALPACTGIFISPTQILSSAHCVYRQRQDKSEEPYWMYGDDNPHYSLLYAITGKMNADDSTFDVYNLAWGCIPQSYIDAENEEVTSVMGNDLVVFEIEGQFAGDPQSIGTISPSVVYDIAKDYMLPQYPSDVNDGRNLVIDKNTTPILFEPLGSGIFFSIDLASWSGSSGGPIIDMNATRINERPAIVGVLMSSGWAVCDSGIVPVTTGIPIVQELLRTTSNARNGRGNSNGRGSLLSKTPLPEHVDDTTLLDERSPEPSEVQAIESTEEADEKYVLPMSSREEEIRFDHAP